MVTEMVHQFNPNPLPDSHFEPGTLRHVVAGNRGRLLDPRRTSVRVVGVRQQTGFFVIEIDDFEDKGARWEVPLEDVGRYQFGLQSRKATDADVASYESLVERFDRSMQIPIEPTSQEDTARRLDGLQKEVSEWIEAKSSFFGGGGALDLSKNEGDERLFQDLRSFLEERSLREMEEAFARQYVSAPASGELVKGHRIAIAHLGLVPYQGKVVRDPGLFDDAWSKQNRMEHILHRLAFVRGVFRKAQHEEVILYRGLSFDGLPDPSRNRTFVSASFDFEVAKSCFGVRDPKRTGVLMRQSVSVDRIFMTYLETSEMNDPFKESEAVLFYREAGVF